MGNKESTRSSTSTTSSCKGHCVVRVYGIIYHRAILFRGVGCFWSCAIIVMGQRCESLLRNHVIPDLQQHGCVGGILFMQGAAPPHIANPDLEPFLKTGSAGRRPGRGRRRATTPNEDRYLVLTARRDRNMNASLLQQHLRSATGTTVSAQSVRNRLHGVGLYARRPMVCVRLTSRHRRDRREWATELVNWRRNEWSNLLFYDESRFSVLPENRRIFIWRDRGSRNNHAFMHESVRFGGGGMLVYGGISIDGCTDLYIIRDGPLTARRYRDEILRPIVVPLRCNNRR
ncbi:transposable element Tcb2 transposase [Trichonephila clavipes]|nr:transposable element Tcb2 transposase [Trichonephila clavipes]